VWALQGARAVLPKLSENPKVLAKWALFSNPKPYSLNLIKNLTLNLYGRVSESLGRIALAAAGLGSAASMICQHYNLPSQECNDLVRSVVLHPTSMFVGVSSLQGSFHDIMNEQGTSNGVTLSSTGTAPQNRAGDLVSLGSGFLRGLCNFGSSPVSVMQGGKG